MADQRFGGVGSEAKRDTLHVYDVHTLDDSHYSFDNTGFMHSFTGSLSELRTILSNFSSIVSVQSRNLAFN